MTHPLASRLAGIHAALITPMTADFALDESALSRHIRTVTAVPGIRGLLVNGHAGENFVLTAAEKLRVVEIAKAAAGWSKRDVAERMEQMATRSEPN